MNYLQGMATGIPLWHSIESPNAAPHCFGHSMQLWSIVINYTEYTVPINTFWWFCVDWYKFFDTERKDRKKHWKVSWSFLHNVFLDWPNGQSNSSNTVNAYSTIPGHEEGYTINWASQLVVYLESKASSQCHEAFSILSTLDRNDNYYYY